MWTWFGFGIAGLLGIAVVGYLSDRERRRRERLLLLARESESDALFGEHLYRTLYLQLAN